MSMTAGPGRPRPYLLVLLLWFAAALFATGSGRVAQLRPPGPQLVLLGLTVALLAAGAVFTGFRIWLAGINLRQLVAVHVARFVGIWFVVLASRGELPAAWALPAGWGDIAIATAALAFVLFVPDLLANRTALLAWNFLGLVDILFVVATAARMLYIDPESMRALLVLPLGLVPTFLGPLVIATHVWLFQRLRRERV
jgi:hypothetical protein